MPVSLSQLLACRAPEPEARFFNVVEKVVLKKDEQIVEQEEGWYSENEMRNDLKWAPAAPLHEHVPMHLFINEALLPTKV